MLHGVHDPIYFPESIEAKLFLALDDLFRNSWLILGDEESITCGRFSTSKLLVEISLVSTNFAMGFHSQQKPMTLVLPEY